MVEVYKNRTSTAFLKPVIWILSDFGNKIRKKHFRLL